MRTGFHVLALAALAMVGVLAADDENVQQALTLTASNFVVRTGATLAGEELQLAPTGSVACVLAFATNQTCTFVVVAHAEAATPLAVRLDTNTVATAQVVSTNLASHSFSVAVGTGTNKLELAPVAASNTVFLSSVTLIGVPLPQLVTTNLVRQPRWDDPVGR
ncbi:MAG: hypothetical protein NTY53_09150 [Kiritimatiellaeota bacterium]|nr:hypothetical protein [Kiritimatiellota bacterium]